MLHSTPDLREVLAGPWLTALPQPVVALDTRELIVAANRPAAELLGTAPEKLTGRPFSATAVPEPHRGGFLDVFRQVCEGHGWAGRLPLVAEPDAELRVEPVLVAGSVAGALVTITPAGPGGDAALRVAERLNRLARVATELQSASTIETVTNIVVSHMADAAGATTASLSITTGDGRLALVGLRGGAPGAATQFATYPIDDDRVPAGVALRTGRPLLLAGRKTILSRFPDLPLAAPGERSILCLPLRVAARDVGVMSLSFPGVLEPDETELEFFQIMADSCASAVERIRAVDTVRQQHAKLTFLARASEELGRSLDYESTLRNVAQMAVPDLADWCAISLLQDGVLRTLAVAHRDPAKVQLALEFQQRYPADPDAESGGYAAVRTGRSVLLPEITDEVLVAGAQSEEHLAMLRDLALHSALTVPLIAEGRVLGTLSWVNGETDRRFSTDDVPFAEDLARRAATAIDNALLHTELREVAERLQEAVRPADLPDLTGWQLDATYRPAGRASVGGDFYEVIPLSDGRVALAIGDVMGRGVTAAASMSQIRAALRALVAVDPDPRSVMTRLDLLYERFPSEQFVTLVYALADPELDQVTLSTAGHPPPAVVRRDGTADFVACPAGTILGAGGAHREAVVVPFLDGETLVLYTDGLVERRDEDITVSEARLLEHCGSLHLGHEPGRLDRLVEELRDPSRDDDVAVLAARRVTSA